MKLNYKRNYGKGVYSYDYGYFNIDKIIPILDEPEQLRYYIVNIIMKKKKYINLVKKYIKEEK